MHFRVTLLLFCVGHYSVSSGDNSSENSESSSEEISESDERGTFTTIDKFPHQVAVKIDDFFCGGFIISERSIVTAAHCVLGHNISNIEVLAGSTFRTEGTSIPLAEVIVHPEYNQTNFDKDVAILNTNESISFSDVIQPVKLAPLGRPVDESGIVVVSGWGQLITVEDEFPDQLMMVLLPVVNRVLCRRAYPNILTENQFCAGYYFFGRLDTCDGDSGGALVQDGLAVGIVSFGRGCAERGSPSGNVDIASEPIREFIKKHTGV